MALSNAEKQARNRTKKREHLEWLEMIEKETQLLSGAIKDCAKLGDDLASQVVDESDVETIRHLRAFFSQRWDMLSQYEESKKHDPAPRYLKQE